jgi:hypothetical protein
MLTKDHTFTTFRDYKQSNGPWWTNFLADLVKVDEDMDAVDEDKRR